MDPDLVLTIGVVLGVLSMPSLLAAWAERSAPRVGAIMIVTAGALIVFAVTQKPEGYTLQDVPKAMLRVVATLVN
jgi:hypothetical protein